MYLRGSGEAESVVLSGEEAMVLLAISILEVRGSCMPMSSAGVSLLRLLEGRFAVFAIGFARGADCPRAGHGKKRVVTECDACGERESGSNQFQSRAAINKGLLGGVCIWVRQADRRRRQFYESLTSECPCAQPEEISLEIRGRID